MRKWSVAFFKQNVFEGFVSSPCKTRKEAREKAKLFRQSHNYIYDYRAVKAASERVLAWIDKRCPEVNEIS